MKTLDTMPPTGVIADQRALELIQAGSEAVKSGKVAQIERDDLDPVLEGRSTVSVVRAIRSLAKQEGIRLRQVKVAGETENSFPWVEKDRQGREKKRENVEFYLASADAE